METTEPKVIPLHPVPKKGSKWWDRRQKHRDAMSSYYEVENANRLGVILVLHHIQYRESGHWLPLSHLYANYEPRDEVEGLQSAEDAARKSRMN